MVHPMSRHPSFGYPPIPGPPHFSHLPAFQSHAPRSLPPTVRCRIDFESIPQNQVQYQHTSLPTGGQFETMQPTSIPAAHNDFGRIAGHAAANPSYPNAMNGYIAGPPTPSLYPPNPMCTPFPDPSYHPVYPNAMNGHNAGPGSTTSAYPISLMHTGFTGPSYHPAFAGHLQHVPPNVQAASGSPLDTNNPQYTHTSNQNIAQPHDFPVQSVEQNQQNQGRGSPWDEQWNGRAHLPSPPQSLAPSCPETPNFKIVIEDPKSPSANLEKRAWSQQATEKQKADSRRLKASGGACLWCYRKKKKCGPEHPCPLCVVNNRKCIRDSSQLGLVFDRPGSENISQKDEQVFGSLRSKIPKETDDIQVIVKLRQPDTEHVDLWVVKVSQLKVTPSFVSNGKIEDLISKLLKYVRSPEMDMVESKFGNHVLVQSAINMVRFFLALKCLCKTKIFIGPGDVVSGRMVMFYALAACTRTLCKMSVRFCSDLIEAMRRKESKEDKSPKSPSHVWIAAGLHYRLVSDIMNFKSRHPISTIFGDMEVHLENAHANLWNILKLLPSGLGKVTFKDALRRLVPEISELTYFDVALWLQYEGYTPSPTALRRQADPYSGTGWDMEDFLDKDFELPQFIPGFSSPSGSGQGSSDQSPSQASAPLRKESLDSISSSQASSQFVADGQDVPDDEFFDFTSLNDCDIDTLIDSFYDDNSSSAEHSDKPPSWSS